MNTKFLSLLAGAALVGSVGFAHAAEPVQLTDTQMDAVTAGYNKNTNIARITQQNFNYQVAYGGVAVAVGKYPYADASANNFNYQSNYAKVDQKIHD